MSEVGVVALSIRAGWFPLKLKGYWYVIRHVRDILAVRRRHQSLRRLPECAVVRDFVGGIYFQNGPSTVLSFANLFLEAYWNIAKRLIVW